MATFTDEEYADTLRIARGYDRSFTAVAPYSLDPSFGFLNQVIFFRDSMTGVENRKSTYKAIDGIDAIASDDFASTHSVTNYFGDILGSNFTERHGTSSAALIKELVERSQLTGANGKSIMYFKAHDSDAINCVACYHDGQITVGYVADSFYGQKEWNKETFPCPYEPGGAQGYFFPEGPSLEAATSLNLFIQKSGVIPPDTIAHGSHDGNFDIDAMVDKGRFYEELLVQKPLDIPPHPSQSHHVATMCLMMTDPRLEPNFEFKANTPTGDALKKLIGPDRYYAGNCVSHTVALGLNFNGGINGKMQHASYNFEPTEAALQADPPRYSLLGLDPFHTQSLAERVFGFEQRMPGIHSLDEFEVPESGACVSLPGHRIFVKKSETGIDVYDTAMNFCGSWDDYKLFRELNHVTSSVMAIVNAKPYTPERKEFFDACRALFYDTSVMDAANDAFLQVPASERTIHTLYSAWSEGASQYPEKVASALSDLGSPVQSSDAYHSDHCDKPISCTTISEMLASQQDGFVVFNQYMKNSDEKWTMLFVKSGDTCFLFDGRFSRCGTIDEINFPGQDQFSDYQISSYGGNDLTRMHEIHTRGLDNMSAITPPSVDGQIEH